MSAAATGERAVGRGRLAGVLAVVLALVVVAGLVIAAMASGSTAVAGDGAPRDRGLAPASPGTVGESPCAWFEDPDGPRVDIPIESGDLHEGATAMWLCGDSMTPGPQDPLTQRIDEAIAAYNSYPPANEEACTEEYRLTYVVALDYPDGQRYVMGDLHGCRTLHSDPTREGGEEWYNLLNELWAEQG